MFIIESTNAKGWRWLSGVFVSRVEAESELAAIADDVRHYHRIVETVSHSFPIFILESRGFEYVNHKQVLEALAATHPRGDDDYIHFNVYAVRQVFRPSTAGTDEMGGLLHWHVTDNTLRQPRARVFKAELAEVAGDA